MTTDPRRQTSAVPLKGSWEALYNEAMSLSRQGSNEALAKLEFLVRRLTRLPQSRRNAQDQRLQTILEQSVLGLQSHFARRNRLDEMASIDEDVWKTLGEDARYIWRENQARAYWWQGRHSEAAEILRVELENVPFDVDHHWLLFSILADDNKIEEAEAFIQVIVVELKNYFRSREFPETVVDDVEMQTLFQKLRDNENPPHSLSVQFGFLHFLRSCLALEKQNWQQAAHDFATATKVSPDYNDRWHLIYRPLVLNSQGKLAQRALNREQNAVSQGFWRGLSGYYTEDRKGAAVEWRRVIQTPLEEVTLSAVGDWILSHYYLNAVQPSSQPAPGSPQEEDAQNGAELADNVRQGLQVALNLLGQERTRRDPLVLGLAALGWGINDNREHLQRNLHHALEILRATFQDNKLSVFNWYFFRDLLAPELFSEVESNFHGPWGARHEAGGK